MAWLEDLAHRGMEARDGGRDSEEAGFRGWTRASKSISSA
jgi:hypothetical protein